jgi:AdoMet-dependent heme synthase
MNPMREGLDLNQRPMVVIWEVTRACDLACFHCRASAQPLRNPLELDFAQARNLMDQVAELKPPVFVLTGGDPLKRPEIFDIISYAAGRHLRPALTPSATPLLTREAIREAGRCGVSRMAMSLDASTAERHDKFRGVPGSWQRTIDGARWAHESGIPVQINTTITRHNMDDLDNMAKLLVEMEVVLWSVFFLVPTGRGNTSDLPTAQQFEDVLEKLYEVATRVPFHVKTTEAPHYRRVIMQHQAVPDPIAEAEGRHAVRFNPHGVGDAKGFVFISHIGDVYPSGFFPLAAGNIKTESLAKIYRESPLFTTMRDSSQLKGKCGACEFKDICGGSRARAFALTGDPMESDPYCIYVPKGYTAKPRPILTLAQ